LEVQTGTEDQAEKRYPRTYQMHVIPRRGQKVTAIFFLTFVAVGLLHLTGILEPPRSRLALALGEIPIAAFSIWYWFSAHRRVILYENAIEVEGWLSSRKLRREEILGRRMERPSVGISIYVIVPIDKSERDLKLPPWLAMDKFFFSWMKTIPQIKR
jgi:hypothetical protein